MTWAPPNPAHALTFDEIELAGLDGTLRDVGAASEWKAFRIVAVVHCATPMQADTVMCERLDYDEMYDDPETGQPFDYEFSSYVIEPMKEER